MQCGCGVLGIKCGCWVTVQRLNVRMPRECFVGITETVSSGEGTSNGTKEGRPLTSERSWRGSRPRRGVHDLFSPKLQVSGPVKEVCVTGRILLDDVFHVVGFLGLAELLPSRKVL